MTMLLARLRSKLLQRFDEFRACQVVRHPMRQDLQVYGALPFLRQVRVACRTMHGDPMEGRFRLLMADLLADCIALDIADARDPQWRYVILRATTMQAMRQMTKGKRPDPLQDSKEVIKRYRQLLEHAPYRACNLDGSDLADISPAQFLDLLIRQLQQSAP